jgi:hypothetical protein
MSFRQEFDEELNLLVVTFTGVISSEEEIRAVEETVRDPRLKPNARILVDRRKARMKATPEDVGPQVDLVRMNQAAFGRPRVAILVADDYSFGMHRLLQAAAHSEVDHDFRVFRSAEEACEWLGIDPAQMGLG